MEVRDIENLGLDIISPEAIGLLSELLETGKITYCNDNKFIFGSDKISVIIPSHNRYEMLLRCVESVLSQTYSNYEIIIIDDASTDTRYTNLEKEFLAKENIAIIHNEFSLGPGKTRQKGYQSSCGSFIVFVDDDDFYIDSHFFETAINEFCINPNVGTFEMNSFNYYVSSNRVGYRALGYCGEVHGLEYLRGFVSKYPKAASSFTTMFRRSVLEEADFQNMTMMNDHSIFLRAACYGDVIISEKVVGLYSIHSENISKNIPYDFLMENLEEKRAIYNIATKFAEERQLRDWYKHQLFVTVKYYFGGTVVSRQQKKGILIWLWNNCPSSFLKVSSWIIQKRIRWLLTKLIALGRRAKTFWRENILGVEKK